MEITSSDEEGLAADNTFALISVSGTLNGGYTEVRFPARSEEFDGTLELVDGTLRLGVVNPGAFIGCEGELTLRQNSDRLLTRFFELDGDEGERLALAGAQIARSRLTQGEFQMIDGDDYG